MLQQIDLLKEIVVKNVIGRFKRFARLSLMRVGVVASPAVRVQSIQEVLEAIRPVKSPFELHRVGSKNDGGYLVPDDYDSKSIGALLSPGVGGIADFELYFAQKGVLCFLIDKSVEKPPLVHSNFHFIPKYLAGSSSLERGEISLEDLIGEVSGTKNVGQKDLILQMDIEGAEWAVLSATPPSALQRFRIMVIEFHDVADLLSSRASHQIVATLFEKLLTDFAIVHIHVNNNSRTPRMRQVLVPNVLEMTLIRRDRISSQLPLGHSGAGADTPLPPASLPHPKDSPNEPGLPEAALPAEWLVS